MSESQSEENEEVEENDNEDNGSKRRIKKIGKRSKKGVKSSTTRKLKYQNKNAKDKSFDVSSSISKTVKERFLYMPFYPLPDLSDLVGELIEIRIASEYLSQSNKAFIERRLYGSDIYTSDSDAVCILQHSGYFQIKDLQPTNIEGVSLFLRVSKGRSTYNTSFKNGIKSKKLNNFQGHSIKPENYTSLANYGTKSELLQMASRMPMISEYERKKPIPSKLADNLYYTEFNMIFNLSYEMWLAYSLPAICDKGRDFQEFTSWKLKDKVLYIETEEKRFEIALNVTDHTNDDYLFEEFETYNLAEVKDPIEKDNDFMLENTVPLIAKHMTPLYKRLDWHELFWGETELKVKDIEIKHIKCFNYFNIK